MTRGYNGTRSCPSKPKELSLTCNTWGSFLEMDDFGQSQTLDGMMVYLSERLQDVVEIPSLLNLRAKVVCQKIEKMNPQSALAMMLRVQKLQQLKLK